MPKPTSRMHGDAAAGNTMAEQHDALASGVEHAEAPQQGNDLINGEVPGAEGAKADGVKDLGIMEAPGARPRQGWDVCFVFEGDPAFDVSSDSDQEGATKKRNERDENRKRIYALLKNAGFAISQTTSRDKSKILMRCSLPIEKMKEKAEVLEWRCKLKEEYGGGHLQFKKEREHCYVNDDLPYYFTPAQRVQITKATVQLDDINGCGINLQQETFDKSFLQFMAFHDPEMRDDLVRKAVWDKWWNPFWDPPYDQLREYLGSQLAIYFAWTAFLGKFLWILSILGTPVYIIYIVNVGDKVISGFNLAYCVIMAIWSALFNEFWKRRNAVLNFRWGTVYFDEDKADNIRPEFVGTEKPGFYFAHGFVHLDDLLDKKLVELGETHLLLPEASNKKQTQAADPELLATRNQRARELNIVVTRRYPGNKRMYTFMLSACLTVFFACCAIAAQVGLLLFRQDIIDGLGDIPIAAMVPGVINAVAIIVLDAVWSILSTIITNKENHRSDEEYVNSLIYKRFGFQFFSNYTSLIFFAFVKPFLSGVGKFSSPCPQGWLGGDEPTCMSDLSFQLLTLLAVRVTVSQALEVLVPWLVTGFKRCLLKCKAKGKKGDGNEEEPRSNMISRYYDESNLPQYTAVINEYNEIVLLFGYVALFAVAFPLAPLLAVFNNLVEVRSDAYKILMFHQRTFAVMADEIGAWYICMQVVSFLAVLSNAGLLVYTSGSIKILFPNVTTANEALAFFIIVLALFAIKGLLAIAVPDTPLPVQKALARQEYDIAFAFGIGDKPSYHAKHLLTMDPERANELAANELDRFDVASDVDAHFSSLRQRKSANASGKSNASGAGDEQEL